MIPTAYPVILRTTRPLKFDRMQVAIRLLVLFAIGVLHQTVGGVFGILYLFLPVAAAILVSGKGAVPFLARESRWMTALLQWVVALYGYLMFVTDRFPLESSQVPVQLYIRASGSPKIGTALLRLLTSLPHALVLIVLSVPSALISLVIAIIVLVKERCPPGLHQFQRDVLAWLARVLAYHASLVESYPPFSLREPGAPPSATDSTHAPSGA